MSETPVLQGQPYLVNDIHSREPVYKLAYLRAMGTHLKGGAHLGPVTSISHSSHREETVVLA